MTGDGRLVPPEGLPDPALPLVPTNAALDHRPTDHDAQTRRVGGPVGLRRPLASDRRKSPRGGSWRRFLSRRPPDADVQLAATNRLPLGKRPAELSWATQALSPSQPQGTPPEAPHSGDQDVAALPAPASQDCPASARPHPSQKPVAPLLFPDRDRTKGPLHVGELYEPTGGPSRTENPLVFF